MYIIYASEPRGISKGVFIGSYLNKNSICTNISKPINAKELLNIQNIEHMDWEEFYSMFPNTEPDEGCTCDFNDVDDEYKEDDIRSGSLSYSEYGGAYGYDDDSIDNAFDGDPENYWNVD